MQKKYCSKTINSFPCKILKTNESFILLSKWIVEIKKIINPKKIHQITISPFCKDMGKARH